MTNEAFPYPQGNVEQGLISAALSSSEKWLELKQYFASEDFTVQRGVFMFAEQYKEEYNNLPTEHIIGSRFDWHPPLGDFQYWLNEMRRYTMASKLTQAMMEAFKEVADPYKARDILLEKLSAERSRETNHIQAYDASAAERWQKYLLRNEYIYNTGNMLGLRTGMRIIDETRIGWTPGNMVGLYGRPGVGKSWWLMWQGALAWMEGNRVLAISGEMPANQLSYRIDVLLGQMLGFPIEFSALQIGDPSVKENYFQITNLLKRSKNFWVYDSTDYDRVGLNDITDLVRLHQPDILLIDNISLLKTRPAQAWEQMRELSYGLKHKSTVHEIPVLVTHQASNTARGKRSEIESPGRGDDFVMPSLNDAAYGDAFVQACSDVITVCGDKQSKYILWYSLRKTRDRGWQQAMPMRMAFAWDIGHGNIIDLSERGYNPEAIGQEARRVLKLESLG